MSLDTLIKAAQYVELQDLKQKQTASPPPTPTTVYTTPIAVTTPVQIKQECVVNSVVASQPVQVQPRRIIHNSFDMINPLVIDEGGELRRKQPPMVFRSGTREVHNKLEKHRRAHLKECFDLLKRQLTWTTDEKKTSNLNILHAAHKTILALNKRERELGPEMERLGNEKIANQQKLAVLKKDLSMMDIDYSALLPEVSTETLGTNGSPKLELEEVIIKEEHEDVDGIKHVLHHHQHVDSVQLSISNDVKVTKSITRALPVVTTNSVLNGVKDGTIVVQTTTSPTATQVQTAALSVLPLSYPMNQGLVLQKVLVPKGLTDFTQLVSNAPVTHFIAAPQQLAGKVVPIVNTQYVVKPLVVVSTPSRSS